MYNFLLSVFPKAVVDILIIIWYIVLMLLVYLFFTTHGAEFKYLEL